MARKKRYANNLDYTRVSSLLRSGKLPEVETAIFKTTIKDADKDNYLLLAQGLYLCKSAIFHCCADKMQFLNFSRQLEETGKYKFKHLNNTALFWLVMGNWRKAYRYILLLQKAPKNQFSAVIARYMLGFVRRDVNLIDSAYDDAAKLKDSYNGAYCFLLKGILLKDHELICKATDEFAALECWSEVQYIAKNIDLWLNDWPKENLDKSKICHKTNRYCNLAHNQHK